jgi:hypothetical protein
MSEDPRCCGSGTCIIDTEGRCWCGQQWNGERMGLPALGSLPETPPAQPQPQPQHPEAD